MDNYNYPPGADTNSAPWNHIDKEPKPLKVTVILTLSKDIEIEVSDYGVEYYGKDTHINYDECNLQEAVDSQVVLPQDVYKTSPTLNKIEELKGWEVEDYQVFKID